MLLLLLNACSQQIESVEESFDDGSPKLVIGYEVDGNDTLKISETHYYPNGSKRMAGAYRNNKRHGRWIAWRADGKKWSEGNYVEGLRQGPSLIYYESGKLHIHGQYKDDDAFGAWKWYDESGKLINTVDYGKGKN